MSRYTRIIALIALAVLILAISGCSGGSSGSSSKGKSSNSGDSTIGATITEENLAFSPSTLTVKSGDTVTFTNNESAPHNVEIDGRELGSQGRDESRTWTAPGAGTYPFRCVIHPSMTGEITVE